MSQLKNKRIGYAVCGSFCTLKKSMATLEQLCKTGADVYPIMSPIVYNTDTRFGTCAEFKEQMSSLCGKDIIHTVAEAEPIGPKKMLDLLIICPCTGNTLGKLANGITDTSVTMAAKAHLRNERTVLIAPSTNDALSGAAKNIGALLAVRGYTFVPFSQDDPIKKTRSCVSDFDAVITAAESALDGVQMQPMIH